MNVLRALSIVLVLAGAAVLMSGSLGFSSVDADRGISAEVVDDSDAYVGYTTYGTVSIEESGTETVLTVRNRYTQKFNSVEITDAVVDKGGDDIVVEFPDSTATDVGIGDHHDFSAEISCQTAEEAVDATVSLTVDVVADDAEAKIEGATTQRQFEVECTPPTPEVGNAKFDGNGNAELVGEDGTVRADVWILTKDTAEFDSDTGAESNGNRMIKEIADVRLEVNEKIRRNMTERVSGDFSIIAIDIVGESDSWVRPTWTGSEINPRNSGNGANFRGNGANFMEGCYAPKEINEEYLTDTDQQCVGD